MWKGRRSTDKSYSRDNRLIFPKSSHRREGLAPRCRLIASWSGSTFQGLGCSPIKAVRELGSERRETVRSISGVGAGILRGVYHSTRGPDTTHQLYISYPSKGKRWVVTCGASKGWQHLSPKFTSRWEFPIGRRKTTCSIGFRYTVSDGFSREILKTDWFWSYNLINFILWAIRSQKRDHESFQMNDFYLTL